MNTLFATTQRQFDGMTESERNDLLIHALNMTTIFAPTGVGVRRSASGRRPPDLYWKNGKVATTDGPMLKPKNNSRILVLEART